MAGDSEVCDRGSLTGGRCELLAGHDGSHEKRYPDGYVQSWTDDQTDRAVKRYMSGRD